MCHGAAGIQSHAGHYRTCRVFLKNQEEGGHCYLSANAGEHTVALVNQCRLKLASLHGHRLSINRITRSPWFLVSQTPVAKQDLVVDGQ
jgi:hypothetical protein